jgi:PAS domain S-box-containing protein
MQATEEMFSRYYDDLPHLTWLGAPDGRVLQVNRVFQEYCGPGVDLQGHGWVNALHPDDAEETLQKWEHARGHRVVFRTHFRLRRHDGVFRWFLAQGTPVEYGVFGRDRFIGTCTDVDENYELIRQIKAAESEAHRQRSLVTTVLQELPIGVVVAAAPDGGILLANHRMKHVWPGPAPSSVSEYDVWEAYHPDGARYRPEEFPLARTLRDRQPVIQEMVEAPLQRHPEQERRTIALTSIPLFDEDGGFLGALAIAEDLHERIMLQREKLIALNDAKAALESARFKSSFVANMSHDLRTPISAISGAVNLLTDTPLDEGQRDLLETIGQCVRTLVNLINDILDLARIEAGKLELEKREFSLRDTIRDVVNMGRAALVFLKKDLSLDTKIGNIPPFVKGDPRRLEQILTNLVGNAIKFTPQHGRVTLELSAEETGDERVILTACVEDTGIGIEEGLKGKLFRPFSQIESGATRKHGGSGLGLSICKDLVGLMGGEIGVDSSPGKGSRFWFKVPFGRIGDAGLLAQGEENERSYEHRALSRDERGEKRLLLAEDNAISAKLALRILKQQGYDRVDWVQNGQEAVAAVQAKDYDLVFMDCQMPMVDGFEATRRIRNLDGVRRHLPIVALTASAQQDDRDACISSGMDAVILKPFRPAELVRTLDDFLVTGEYHP